MRILRTLIVLCLFATPAYAQLGIFTDPTTYTPAIIYSIAAQQDWRTSQVFFAHGWKETNPRFTKERTSPGTPVSYARGMGTIRGYSALVLAHSVVNNLAVGAVTLHLTKRWPHKRKLIKTLGWVEKVTFASILTHSTSTPHFKQANLNRKLAKGL